MKNNIDVLEQSESDRINEKLNQLLDSHGWSCSLLDMVSDCQAAAESNYEKLLDAVREGKKILVDGKYYISIPTTIKATEKEISYCNILGQSDNAEFVFTSDGTMFTVQKAKEILVDGIALTATAENITMFWLNSTGHIDNFTFSNTTCTRKIRCLETSGTSSDPSGIGIKNIRINKNQLLNQDLDFLKFINMPFEVCEISENKIRNFTSAKCFDLHISNTNTYYKEIRARRTKTICRDNELINDDSCYLTNSSFNYYTLILLEGKQCHYTGNHVEGLKSNHNVNLYDAYLTADEVIYEGNTNKNNMCFSSLKGLNCELVKAKDGHVRYIKNNRFIVEKSWLDRLNKEQTTSITSICTKLKSCLIGISRIISMTCMICVIAPPRNVQEILFSKIIH
ncbi:hypothetical protein [Caldalkalibacillus mannanilyticus]|uniref:hypothetical protein n=1 Tax=Caldalkalibacillus mannanilyticus TaxID=1418 RepID=UPI00046A01D1|nr:hypothetical protein [Caldalkalibacillus mannanilyticus]